MKTVYPSRELAHVWAHQGAPYGKRFDDYMSFHGPAFYSYKTVIARILKSKDGHRVYVLDYARFSSSTSKHQSHVRAAIPEAAPMFIVHMGEFRQDLDFTPKTLRDYYLNAAKESVSTSRYKHMRAQAVKHRAYLLNEAIRVCQVFGLSDKRISAKLAAMANDLNQANQVVEAWNARPPRANSYRSRYEIRQAKQAEQDAENAPKWLAGEHVSLSYDHPVLLRASGDDMETSKGARVPLKDAYRAYRFAILVRAKGWHRNGERFALGMYELDAVNENGVIAGCHRVSWAEIDRFATLMGWPDSRVMEGQS